MPHRFSLAPREPGDWSVAEWKACAIGFTVVALIEAAIVLARLSPEVLR